MPANNFVVDGIALSRGETHVAAKARNMGRTRYLEGAKALGIKPLRVLGKNLWTPEEAERIFQYYVRKAAAEDAGANEADAASDASEEDDESEAA